MSNLLNLTNLVPGAFNDPAWEQVVVNNYSLIIGHNHDGANHGTQVAFNNLDFTSLPNFGTTGVTGVEYLSMPLQAASPPTVPGVVSGTGSLQVDQQGELWYTPSYGSSSIQITNAGALNNTGSVRSIYGQYSTAGTVYYNATGSTTLEYTYGFFQPTNGSVTWPTSTLANLTFASAYLTGTTPSLYFSDTGVTTEALRWGVLSDSTYLLYGWRATENGTYLSAPAYWYQTYASRTISVTGSNSDPNTSALTYGLYLNLSPLGSSASALVYGVPLAVRTTTQSNSTKQDVAVFVSASSGGTGSPNAISSGFGAGFSFLLQQYNSFTGILQAGRITSSWTNVTDQYTDISLYVAAAGNVLYSYPVISGAAVSSSAVAVSINTPYAAGGANTTTIGGTLYMYSGSGGGHIYPTQNNTQVLGASGAAWASVYTTDLTVTGSASIAGLTLSGTVTAPSLSPTQAGPSGASGGSWKNNQILASVLVNSTSGTASLLAAYNVATAVWSGTTCTVNLTYSVASPSVAIVTGYNTGVVNYFSGDATCNGTTVVVHTFLAGSASAQEFQVVVVGSPS